MQVATCVGKYTSQNDHIQNSRRRALISKRGLIKRNVLTAATER